MKMHEEVEALAILIHDLRKFKNLTLGELAERINRSVGFLSQVERGVSRPTVADLTAISEALGVSTAYFYNLSKPRSSKQVTRPTSGARCTSSRALPMCWLRPPSAARSPCSTAISSQAPAVASCT